MDLLNSFDFISLFDDDEKDCKCSKNHVLEAPRHREMNDDDTDDFVAIDFETMTCLHTSACSVGMVKVIDGQIVQQFYSLINPVRDEYTDCELNRNIHGIALETAEKAGTFADLFPTICAFIENYPLVAHNKSVEVGIIESLQKYYGLSGIRTDNAICTYKLTGKSLSKCCEEYGIKETGHHNALWDAEVCARIYLEILGKPILPQGGGSIFGAKGPMGVNTAVSKEHRGRLDLSQITNKNTPFFNSTVVITGVFEKYPDRDKLAGILQNLGAKVTSAISCKTTHVVLGECAGPKKIEKIKELKESGANIIIVREHELIKLLENK